jgi:hypothetical protein
MTQLALMRELLAAFSGNELVFGISLGSWLLLTAAGTWLGRILAPTDHRNETSTTAKTAVRDATLSSRAGGGDVSAPIDFLVVGLICIAVLPLMQVVAVRVLRDVVFVRGATAGVTGTVLASMAEIQRPLAGSTLPTASAASAAAFSSVSCSCRGSITSRCCVFPRP